MCIRDSLGRVFTAARQYPIIPCLILLVFLVLPAIFANQLAQYNPRVGKLSERLIPPAWADGEIVDGIVVHKPGSWAHPLGTDKQGRDVLTREIYGARV